MGVSAVCCVLRSSLGAAPETRPLLKPPTPHLCLRRSEACWGEVRHIMENTALEADMERKATEQEAGAGAGGGKEGVVGVLSTAPCYITTGLEDAHTHTHPRNGKDKSSRKAKKQQSQAQQQDTPQHSHYHIHMCTHTHKQMLNNMQRHPQH